MCLYGRAASSASHRLFIYRNWMQITKITPYPNQEAFGRVLQPAHSSSTLACQQPAELCFSTSFWIILQNFICEKQTFGHSEQLAGSQKLAINHILCYLRTQSQKGCVLFPGILQSGQKKTYINLRITDLQPELWVQQVVQYLQVYSCSLYMQMYGCTAVQVYTYRLVPTACTFLPYFQGIVKISFSMQYARILHRHPYHLPLCSYVRFSHKKAHPHPLFCTFP